MDLKKLTLLHSNDMHGDFLAENIDDKLVGGVSMLSGFIAKTRAEERNVIYAIAGDMFRGSVIDSEYKGLSTIEIMNMLAPDVVTIGNHEADYGLAHLLFLEKCAGFPIVNANLRAKPTGSRLFTPCHVLRKDGLRILFIGVITEEILAEAQKDEDFGSLIEVTDAAREVAGVCAACRGSEPDLTVLLTHIGVEADKKLAAELDPACGVDIIIGGHSHTVMEQPLKVNDILIVQAGTGTDYIGRFDLEIDADKNSVSSWRWRLEPIEAGRCPRDEALEKLITGYKSVTDKKYGRVVTRLARELTHPRRNMETELGDLFCDLLTDSLGVDAMLLASGSLRLPKLGPIVTFGRLEEIFPFKDKVCQFKLTGAQLRRVLTYLMRDEMFAGATEFYQLPRALRLRYSRGAHKLTNLTFKGAEVRDGQSFTLAAAGFHFSCAEQSWGLTREEFAALQPPKVIAGSDFQVVEEYLSSHQNLDARTDGRISIED